MKKISLLVASTAFANDKAFLDEAKAAGLAPLPKDQAGVEKLLKEMGVKASKFSKEKANLGKKLYFEPRLSKSGLISCNTCHNLGMGGADGIAQL